MRSKLIFILVLFFLTGCFSAPATPRAIPTPTAQACDKPGTISLLTDASIGQIGVYLPPCYNAESGILYPVLYLLPGAGGSARDWRDAGVAASADKAIQSGETPPFLIVLTDDTFEDISPDTITGTLIPYVESHYRAGPERRWRAVAGGSLGGASAYFLAFQHPDLFASAGVFGNGLVTGMTDKTSAMLQVILPGFKPRVFLNSGESDSYMLQHAQMLIPLLDEAGIAHTEIFGPGNHSYQYWLSNFPAYFRWLAKDWQ